jgi:hypothetical protein
MFLLQQAEQLERENARLKVESRAKPQKEVSSYLRGIIAVK